MVPIAIYNIIIREPLLTFMHYRVSFKSNKSAGQMIFCADGKFPHGGMFDRLKGAISVYAASKVLIRDFRINFTSPFQLEQYLEPNQYDWSLREGEYNEDTLSSKLVFMYGEYDNPYRLLKKRKKNTHFYYGFDSLDFINKCCDTSFVWGNLYRELFKPTAYLQRYIDLEKEKIGFEYVAIHLRFMNLLGDKIEFDCDPTLPIDEQEQLKSTALSQVEKIVGDNCNMKVLLATDSNNFASYALSKMPFLYVIPGNINHIGTVQETSDDVNMKMFLDYYMIAGAKRVYNIVGPGMWKSAFSEYAAKIGGCEFERILF